MQGVPFLWPTPQIFAHPTKGLDQSLAYCLANLFGEANMLQYEGMAAEHLRDFGDLVHSLYEASEGQYRLSPLAMLPLGYEGPGLDASVFGAEPDQYLQQGAFLALVLSVRDFVPLSGLRVAGKAPEAYLRQVLFLLRAYAPGGYLIDPSRPDAEPERFDQPADLLKRWPIHALLQVQKTLQGPDTIFAVGSFRPLLSDPIVERERQEFGFGEARFDPEFAGPQILPDEKPAALVPEG